MVARASGVQWPDLPERQAGEHFRHGAELDGSRGAGFRPSGPQILALRNCPWRGPVRTPPDRLPILPIRKTQADARACLPSGAPVHVLDRRDLRAQVREPEQGQERRGRFHRLRRGRC